MSIPNNNYRNSEQDRRIEVLEKHIGKLNSEMGDVKVDVAQVKTDISWLKRYFWVVIVAAIGATFSVVVNYL